MTFSEFLGLQEPCEDIKGQRKWWQQKKRSPGEIVDADEVDIVGPRLSQLVLRAQKISSILQAEEYEVKFKKSSNHHESLFNPIGPQELHKSINKCVWWLLPFTHLDIHHIAINLDLTDLECGEILNSPSFWMVVHDLESSNVAALFSVLWNLSGQHWTRSPNIHNVIGKFSPNWSGLFNS